MSRPQAVRGERRQAEERGGTGEAGGDAGEGERGHHGLLQGVRRGRQGGGGRDQAVGDAKPGQSALQDLLPSEQDAFV